MLACASFVVTTLAITATWVYTGRNYSLSTLSFAMFFPSMFSPWFNEDPDRWKQIVGLGKGTLAITNSIMAGLFVIVILAAVCAINYSTGWGKEVAGREKLKDGSGDLFMGFVRAAGEEIGWRCYLLPELMKNFTPLESFLISGLVWGLFHVPIMLLLTKRFKSPDPYKTVAVQFIQCVLNAFPHGWVAVKSEYSMWAPTVMHFTWNRINPVIFGSIYTQQRGKMVGKQWLMNGEGLAGCIALLPCTILMVVNL